MPNPSETAGETREGQRIAKVMARAGLCSRRDAEQWIAEGRVSVNGEVLTSPAFNVADTDNVSVDGAPLRAAERTRLFLFHKPRGLVTTAKDPEGRATIFDALPEDLPRVVAVGRLDINTEGLLLLTNDGGLSRILELPSTGWLRRYRVRAHGEVTQGQLDELRDGVTIEGVNYLGIEARFERQQGSNVWLMMGLREGKNREIKRVLEHMGLSVNRLIRVSFGPFELADLPEGAVEEVRTRVLRDQLGPKLSKAANANFDAPVEAPAPAPEAASRGDRPPRRGPPREQERPLDREQIRAEVASRGARRETVEPRKRKHVSVLRAEAREEAAGSRKRITRATTADRKGREVKIERVSLARPPEDARPPRPAAEEGFGPRRQRAEARPPRREGSAGPRRSGGEGYTPRPRDDSRPPRREGSAGPRRSSGEGYTPRLRDDSRAPRREGSAGPRRSSGEGYTPRPRDDSRAPRREGSAGPRRSGGEGFTPRPRDDARPPRREGSAGPRRSGGEGYTPRPRDDARPPRREGSAGPRRSGGEGFTPRPRDDARPPRREGAPMRTRPSGERDGRPPRSGPGRGPSPKRPGGGGKGPRAK
jgi:23S rRNA pseudouridine2605 synthase